MSKVSEFFSMTRRERIGAIVVVLLIVLVVFSLFLIRSCNSQKQCVVPTPALDQFEQQTDTAVHQVEKKEKKPKKEKKEKGSGETHKKKDVKKKAKKSEKKKTGSEPERTLDPVPTF